METQPTDKGGLSDQLDAIVALVRKYVVVGEHEARITALWAAHTHLFDAAGVTPYLLVTSPSPRAGKTLLLDLLSTVGWRPWFVVSPTQAALFRKVDADRPTVLVDEIDALMTTLGLQAVFNSGYRAGGMVPRVDHRSGVVEEFRTFCPKALAGIAGRRAPLPSSTLDRCVEIRLKRRLPTEPVARYRRANAVTAAAPIQQYFADARPDLVGRLEGSLPDCPDGLDDRAAEILEPLLAIADLAGGDWPRRAREAALALTVRRDDDPHDGIAIVRDTKRAFEGDRMASRSLLLALRKIDDPDLEGGYATMNAATLAGRLRAFEIRPNVIRLTPTKTARGYKREFFREAWERYAGGYDEGREDDTTG